MGKWSRRQLALAVVVVVMAMAMVGGCDGRKNISPKSKASPKSPTRAPAQAPAPAPNPKRPTPAPAPAPAQAQAQAPEPAQAQAPKPAPAPGSGGDKGDNEHVPPSFNIFDVMSYGAQGDGQTDDTQAFMETWRKACQVEGAMVEVPGYFIFVLGPLMFSGPCQSHITFQIDGKIIPSDTDSWSSSDVPQWIGFSNVENLVLQGQGLLDGKGDYWWSLACKGKSPSGHRTHKTCDSPTAIRFYGTNNVVVRDLTIANSPQMHMRFDGSTNVQVDNISISSPSNSPNTDGIHIQNCQKVEIQNCYIESGDDCISIQTGSSNVEVHDVYCGYGHGISIGGLGKGGTQACVSDISVHDVHIKDSTNGVRIKTWQGASGSAKRINFSNVMMENTSNPILIDQFYCDAHSCKNQSSAIHVSDVTYSNIKGTYNLHGQPVRLACSDSIPCTKISLSNIELEPMMDGLVGSSPFCWNAYGNIETSTIPPITCILDELPVSRNGNPLSIDDNC